MPDLEISQIRLLVKGGLHQSEGVNDVVDGRSAILDAFLLLLSRWIGTWTVIKLRVFPTSQIKDEPISTSPSLIVTIAQSTSYTMSSTSFLPDNQRRARELRVAIDDRPASTYNGKASENISSPLMTSE
jgi:hypothetical protein